MSRHNTEHSTKHLCVIFLKFFFFIAQHVFLGTVWSFFFLCCSLPWSLIIHNINKCLAYTPSGFVLIGVLAIFPVNANCWRFTYCDYFVTMLPFIKHKLTHRFLLATFRLLIYFSLVESMAGQCQRKKKKLIVRPEKIVKLYKICLAKSKHAMAMQATRTTSEQNQLAWLRLSI